MAAVAGWLCLASLGRWVGRLAVLPVTANPAETSSPWQQQDLFGLELDSFGDSNGRMPALA